MRESEQLKVGDLSEIAQGPGRSPAQTASRWRRWVAAGIIPADGQVQWKGGPANLFPRSAAAVGLILFDLYDAGVVTDRHQLAAMWRHFSEHEEGNAPLIIHVLAEIGGGNPAYLIITAWRHQTTGDIVPTCAIRFADELERGLEAPTDDHRPIGDYVIKLHHLLARFATPESNVLAFKAGA